jgi:hypothetical protein
MALARLQQWLYGNGVASAVTDCSSDGSSNSGCCIGLTATVMDPTKGLLSNAGLEQQTLRQWLDSDGNGLTASVENIVQNSFLHKIWVKNYGCLICLLAYRQPTSVKI